MELYEPVEGQALETDDKKFPQERVISGNILRMRSKVVDLLTRGDFASELVQHQWFELSR